MIIFGAGMSGLLAANMLRRYQPTLCEAQRELPDNHGALLRFRSDAVSKATGQHFKKVLVQKAVKYNGMLWHKADIQMSNMYSRKVAGEVMTRSVMNLEPGERYIAPDDFIATMALGVGKLELGMPLTPGVIHAHCETELKSVIISTVPMPVLMDVVDWPDKPEFRYLPIWSFKARIVAPTTRVYQTIYYPDTDVSFYRASITGDQLIIEYTTEATVAQGLEDAYHIVMHDFGIGSLIFDQSELEDASVKFQKYGKLLPIDESVRRSFILAMTDQYGIYSVGRFATWRQILMDDVVHDVEVVERFIRERNQYNRQLHWR